MAYFCESCKKMFGVFDSSAEYEGKKYCKDCYNKIPKPKHYGKKCPDCAYYGYDDYLDGFCKFDHNRYIDGYGPQPACEHFRKR